MLHRAFVLCCCGIRLKVLGVVAGIFDVVVQWRELLFFGTIFQSSVVVVIAPIVGGVLRVFSVHALG